MAEKHYNAIIIIVALIFVGLTLWDFTFDTFHIVRLILGMSVLISFFFSRNLFYYNSYLLSLYLLVSGSILMIGIILSMMADNYEEINVSLALIAGANMIVGLFILLNINEIKPNAESQQDI